MKPQWTAQDIEILVADHFNARANLIVPNVSWGWGLHYEADVVVLRPSGYAIEIEIKVTAADIRRDGDKRHGHSSNRFRELWFAVPATLAADSQIPQHAGIFAAARLPWDGCRIPVPKLTTIRAPQINKAAPRVSESQRLRLAELGAMRIWDLKRHLQRSAMERIERLAKEAK